MASEAVGR